MNKNRFFMSLMAGAMATCYLMNSTPTRAGACEDQCVAEYNQDKDRESYRACIHSCNEPGY